VTVVETERLLLRPWADDDVDALASVFAEPEVWRYPFGRAFSREETERFLASKQAQWARYGFGSWAAVLKEDGRLIGYIGLAVPEWLPEVLPAVEVGYRLHPDHWGRGLATEGASASLDYGFRTLALDRIIGIFTPENAASGRVMEKLGLRHRGMARDPQWKIPLVVREITREDWLNA
jgi:RimJ/RimL family protein N-acetyltransferase